MKNRLLTLLLTAMLLTGFVTRSASQPNPCTDCGRRGMVVEFNNPSNPDYEQKRQEWRDCMTALLGNYVSFSDEDPKVAEAAEKCSGIVPENDAYCFPEIVSGYLGQHHSNSCFYLLNPEYSSKMGGKEPEYIFKGSYEPNLEGGRIVEAVTDLFKPIVAQMTLNLYYNGTTPEPVRTWFAESTLNSPRGLLHKLNIPKSIKPIFDDFEKRPVRCDVKIPLPEEICENGTAEIELSGFSDINGNSSKGFNRIIVSIYKGEILNGENSDFGPDWKVFTVGEGTVKVKYRPPEKKEDGWEWLRVYNSCEILPAEKSPMSGTQMDTLIVNQRFPIACGYYKGELTVTQTWDYADDYGNSFIGSKTVTCKGTFKPIEEFKGKDDQPLHMYGPSKVMATWEINEDKYCGGESGCPGHCRQESGQGTINPEMWQEITIMTWVFPLEIKEVADQLRDVGMENYYEISVAPGLGDVITETREKSGNPCVWSVKQSEEGLPGAVIRLKLVHADELKGHKTWKSKHEATSGSIEITDMPDFQGEHTEPLKPVPDGADYTYTVTWNLKAL